MSYASVKDVTALAPTRKLGKGGNPTEADVKVYLELAESEIDAILVNKGYAVPVSETDSPQAFAFLRRVVAQGAVAQLEEAAGNGPNIERSRKTYNKSLSDISEAVEIMDAAQNTERSKPRGPGVTTVQPTPGNEPMFSRDEKIMQF